jgi:transposase
VQPSQAPDFGLGAGCPRTHSSWFCGLGIEDRIPDHSTFTRARNERFRDGDIFRRVFERVVATCIAAGLVGGKGFAVDASLIVADANKCRSTSTNVPVVVSVLPAGHV